ncbi:cell surface protein [Chryseobacterium fluminis]|uniref:cell surface protein n=1 Tax=Chryseobacterium fluminis TaxID=2983606 RepID=UPI002253FDE1|nr:cell surface protein [Chryseobacterium sp. MMS21-Ot14]UZT96718.1 cell surface protein [Chryseobacterium sp. MMS21-Ot14]
MERKTFNVIKTTFLALTVATVVGCKSDREDEDTSNFTGLEESYTINRFKVLNINPKAGGTFTWSINDSVISQNAELDFISPVVKTYPLTLKIESSGGVKTYQSKIIVSHEAGNYSKYISDVLDFRPAVGQFINEVPEYTAGNTSVDMLQKAKTSLIGGNSTMITLGGYGGSVTFGFDHTIPNMNGKDFKILGNAFWGNDTSQPRSGSCEPGIIVVAYDRNKNGKPDEDEWYEIAGSEYFKNTTVKNYSITYFKPNENKIPVPGNEFWQTDTEYIKWEDNLGNSGFKTKNTFHGQSYYPLWLTDSSYGFSGTKLQNNFYDQSGTGSYWVGKSYDFGYADNAPNNDDASNIDISWAVDKNGKYVKLPGIDFVKVYTGINQEAGWLGEVSTEVAGAYDLHLN